MNSIYLLTIISFCNINPLLSSNYNNFYQNSQIPKENNEIKEYDTDDIEYYTFYLVFLVVSYVLLVLLFRQLNYTKEKRDKMNETLDYYGVHEKKQIIHNELTKEQTSLRRKFLISSTLIKSSIWIKAPYMFALYNRIHKFTRPEIGILYLIENLTSLLLGPIIGSLCDMFGRKKFCVLYAFLLAFQIVLRITGIRLLAYPAQFFTGICSVLIDTSFESWLNFEANTIVFSSNTSDALKMKNSYLREIFSKQMQLDCLTSIVSSGITTLIYVS